MSIHRKQVEHVRLLIGTLRYGMRHGMFHVDVVAQGDVLRHRLRHGLPHGMFHVDVGQGDALRHGLRHGLRLGLGL